MRIAMMGSGGIGGYFGGRLAAAGTDVTFIARGRHLAAMRETGLRLDSRDRGDATIHPVNATDDPASIGPVDYVIIGVKLWDTEDVGRSILPMLGPDTAILSLQNGVDCDDILAPIVGRERLISGVAFIASSISEPGVIRHIGTLHRIVMGEPDGTLSPSDGTAGHNVQGRSHGRDQRRHPAHPVGEIRVSGGFEFNHHADAHHAGAYPRQP